MPCTEIRTPDYGKIYIDRDGLAWTVDSRRLPEYDASGPEPERVDRNAEIARKLARLHEEAHDWPPSDAAWARIQAIEDAAIAAGCEREFRALVTGGTT
jgi:hypothetical protein